MNDFSDTDIGVSGHDDGTAVTTARQTIQQEIGKLKFHIRIWRARQNSFNLTMRLSDESLSLIFQFAAGVLQSSLDGLNPNRACRMSRPQLDHAPWKGIQTKPLCICISHVCSRWRRIALECPALWYEIPLGSPPLAREMLRRTMGAPLDIEANLDFPTAPAANNCFAVVLAATSEAPRLRNLAFSQQQFKPAILDMVLASLNNAAPLLQTFTVHYPSTGFDPDFDYDLPEDLFSGQTPNLKKLDVRGCSLNWQSTILCTSLSSLTIHDAMTPPSTRELLDVLNNLPKLATLDLKEALPLVPDSITSFPILEFKVQLPHLVDLKLDSWIGETAHFFGHLICPSLKFLKVRQSDRYSYEFDSILASLRHLEEFVRSVQTEPSICLHLGRRTQDPGAIVLETWGTWGGACDTQMCHEEKPQITFEFSQPLAYTEDETQKILNAIWTHCLSSKALDSLYIFRFNPDPTIWSNSFSKLPRLETLSSVDPDFSYPSPLKNRVPSSGGILNILSTYSSGEKLEHESKSELPFPVLRKLTLRGWNFEQSCHGGICLFDELKACLQKRSTDIQTLVMKGCRFALDKDVEDLSGSVKNIIWE